MRDDNFSFYRKDGFGRLHIYILVDMGCIYIYIYMSNSARVSRMVGLLRIRWMVATLG